MEQRLRASPEQFAALLDFMERHGDLSRPQPGPRGRLRSDELWHEIAAKLNSLPGVQKPLDRWKKVWADWKAKTKKKAIIIRRTLNGPTGVLKMRQKLTSLEQRVMAIKGIAVFGQPTPQEPQPSPQEIECDKSTGTETPIKEELIWLEIPYSNPSPHEPARMDFVDPPSPSAAPPPDPPVPVLSPVPSVSSPADHTSAPSPAMSASPPDRVRSSTPVTNSPRRTFHRKRRGLTPLERATSEFVAVEQARLQFEERREELHHEREIERMRMESRRIDADLEHTRVLNRLADIAKKYLEKL